MPQVSAIKQGHADLIGLVGGKDDVLSLHDATTQGRKGKRAVSGFVMQPIRVSWINP
jgi:hypothetical protein